MTIHNAGEALDPGDSKQSETSTQTLIMSTDGNVAHDGVASANGSGSMANEGQNVAGEAPRPSVAIAPPTEPPPEASDGMASANGRGSMTNEGQNVAGEAPRPSVAIAPPTEPPPEASDRWSPRDQTLESCQRPNTQEWYLYALAAVVVLGFFALTVTMMLKEVPKDSQNVAYMLLGGLVTGFSMVLSYFFGSSAGSAQKTAQITALVKKSA